MVRLMVILQFNTGPVTFGDMFCKTYIWVLFK